MDPGSEGALVELMTWISNVYSGFAHEFGWLHLVPGSKSMPEHFVTDLYMDICVADFAFDVTLRRTIVPV